MSGQLNPAKYASQPTELQYAIPVSVESFVRGFIVHQFWAPRIWRPRLRVLRECNYEVLDKDGSSRRISQRLPEEVLQMIQEHVIVDSLDEGRQAWRCRSGALRAATDAQLFRTLARLKYHGVFRKVGYVNDLVDDPVRLSCQIFPLYIEPL